MQLSDEQKQAVECEEDSVISAVAGSGKTHTLVAKAKRYSAEELSVYRLQ